MVSFLRYWTLVLELIIGYFSFGKYFKKVKIYNI